MHSAPYIATMIKKEADEMCGTCSTHAKHEKSIHTCSERPETDMSALKMVTVKTNLKRNRM